MRCCWASWLFFGVFTPVAFAGVQVTSEKQDEAGLKGLYDDKEDVLDSVHKMTNQQLTEIHGKMDADKDGKVTLAETEKFAHDMRRKLANKRLDKVIATHDINKDKKLTLDEFLRDLTSQHVHPDARAGHEEIKTKRMEAFKEIDLNNDGFVDRDELPLRFHHYTNDLVDERLATQSLKNKDKNGDGKLSNHEFWSHMYPQGKSSVTPDQQKEFDDLDKDSTGFLELEEVKQFESGSHHTKLAMKELFDAADKDKDNKLSSAELINAKAHFADFKHASAHVREWHQHGHGGEL